MIFIILGPSGCGKGTQADLLAKKYGLTHISMGELLRLAYEQKTDLGLKAYEWWGKGLWVPTELVGQLLQTELQKHPRGGFVLEGWPRLSEQKEFLAKFLSGRNLIIDKVFYLDTPAEVAVERIKGRIKRALSMGASMRIDDREEVIKQRLQSYFQTIEPILGYYRRLGALEVIDNRPSIEEVSGSISKIIDDYLKKA